MKKDTTMDLFSCIVILMNTHFPRNYATMRIILDNKERPNTIGKYNYHS